MRKPVSQQIFFINEQIKLFHSIQAAGLKLKIDKHYIAAYKPGPPLLLPPRRT